MNQTKSNIIVDGKKLNNLLTLVGNTPEFDSLNNDSKLVKELQKVGAIARCLAYVFTLPQRKKDKELLRSLSSCVGDRMTDVNTASYLIQISININSILLL